MRNRILTSICAIWIISLTGCNTRPTENDLGKLNGYWEIKKVVLPDGSVREFKVNPIIDHLILKDLNGIRTKVRPMPNGKFETASDGEDFLIEMAKDTIWLRYRSNFGTWREGLLQVSDQGFSVIDTTGTIYDYRKFVPLSTMPQ